MVILLQIPHASGMNTNRNNNLRIVTRTSNQIMTETYRDNTVVDSWILILMLTIVFHCIFKTTVTSGCQSIVYLYFLPASNRTESCKSLLSQHT